MTGDPVAYDCTDDVVTVRLDRPDRRNALSTAVVEAVVEALDRADTDGARCVVIEGSDGVFSAGGDIDRLRDRLESDRPVDAAVREVERTTHRVIDRVATVPVPTIAKIDGPAVGAGAALAIACDIQLASERSTIGFVFRNVGLSVDSGTSHFLPRLVGANVAKELIFTGEVIGADRAHDLGLINHVHPDDEIDAQARAMAEHIASGPTVALRRAKDLLESSPGRPLDRALHDEAVAQGIVFESRDHGEGVEAFFAGRDPTFEGR